MIRSFISRHSNAVVLGVTLLWASHAWYLVAILSQYLMLPFYILVQGQGLVQYPDVFVLVSPAADAAVIIILGFVLLAAHSFLPDRPGQNTYVSHLLTALWSVGLFATTFIDPRFIFLVSISFVGVMVDDSRRFAHLLGTRARAVFAWLGLWMILEAGAVAVLGVAQWVWFGLGGPNPLSGRGPGFAIAGLRILGLGYAVLPEVVLIFLFSWLLRPLLKGRLALPAWPNDSDQALEPEEPGPRRAWSRYMLVAGVALALFVGAYPYLPSVNPGSVLVGRDVATSYGCWLNAVPCSYHGFSLDNQRLGALWLLQGIAALAGSADLALKLAPALWAVLLVVGTYVLVRQGTGDDHLAGLSALLTSVSLGTVTGLEAGLLANWLALSIAYLFFAVLLMGLRKRRPKILIPAFALSMALLFVHPWTWVLIMGVLAVYLGVELAQGLYTRSIRALKLEAGVLGALLGLGLAADAVRGLFPAGSALVLGFDTVFPILSPSNVPLVLANLQKDFAIFVGGAETDLLWFLLAAVGVWAIPSFRGRFGKLLVCWLASVAVLLPFVTPSQELLQARLIFDLPMQILAAIGLARVSRALYHGLGSESGASRRWMAWVPAITTAATVALALGFALEYAGFLFT